ncbi:sensor histidine kinase [Sphingobacterium sp. LRF_L2]|uniref:sensor histidine kinase n=1 Tax=Sphingobacterium sp. LRF_L2 TaxID=3369421 RepID=UPI003F5E7769
MDEIQLKEQKSVGPLPTRLKRMLLVCFAFTLFYLVSYVIDPYNAFWIGYFDRNLYEVITEWVITFMFCLLISESSIFIHRKLNQRVPWTRNKTKRLTLEIILNFSAVVILIMMNMLCCALIYSDSSVYNSVPSIEEIRGILQWIVISLLISFMIISVNTVSYLINNWIETSMEMSRHKLQAAELRQASIQAELNSLKLQLDPHFIFNNLSVLSELILENQQLGFEYAENFAKVYRFLLVNSKKNMISLEEEIKFLYAYIFLIENRVGDGVNFVIDVQEHSKAMYIPPLTLQLLIENAIKHNKTNRKNPLIITISNPSQGLLFVENTCSPIENAEISSTGIGLNNIINRFKLLGSDEPMVFKSDNLFKVSIKLLPYDRKNSNC